MRLTGVHHSRENKGSKGEQPSERSRIILRNSAKDLTRLVRMIGPLGSGFGIYEFLDSFPERRQVRTGIVDLNNHLIFESHVSRSLGCSKTV